jgi:hypothetical protein
MNSVVIGSISEVSEVYTASVFRIRMSKLVNVDAYINFDPIGPYGRG